MHPEEFTYYYFIGIGGIGMSALARYFKAQGKQVAGYDRTPSSLTRALEKEGIPVSYSEEVEAILPAFRQSPSLSLVVYTPAVPPDHKGLEYFRKSGYRVLKRAEVLGMIFNRYHGIAVAGTHGKTTVSTMAAYLLHHGKLQLSAFLGGISKNFGSNLVLSAPTYFVVAEADEFDRSFLQLSPSVAVITAMDPDHLDIYHTKEAVVEAFMEFTRKIKPGGVLILREGLPLPRNLPAGVSVYRYGFSGESDFAARNIAKTPSGHSFDVKTPSGMTARFELCLPGKANVENALAALAVSWACRVPLDSLIVPLKNFSGVSRRFDVRVDTPRIAYVDDYGHHPEEIKAFIAAMRDRFPGRKLTGIFQPHLYTRTRDFADAFAESLSRLDRLILLDIYPAREKPIPGITSEMIFRKVALQEKYLCSKEALPEFIQKFRLDVVATMGAGDIDTLVEPLTDLFLKKSRQ